MKLSGKSALQIMGIVEGLLRFMLSIRKLILRLAHRCSRGWHFQSHCANAPPSMLWVSPAMGHETEKRKVPTLPVLSLKSYNWRCALLRGVGRLSVEPAQRARVRRGGHPVTTPIVIVHLCISLPVSLTDFLPVSCRISIFFPAGVPCGSLLQHAAATPVRSHFRNYFVGRMPLIGTRHRSLRFLGLSIDQPTFLPGRALTPPSLRFLSLVHWRQHTAFL
jgi:hypothetical protein